MEIANLKDAEFKTLVIRMLRELSDYGNNLQEEVKVILSEIKEKPQGINRKGKKAVIQTNDLEHKKETNIQPEQKEDTRILKNEDRLKNLWDISKHTNIRNIEMPEGEEEEQEIANLFKNIMKENFPNLVRVIDIQVQEEQRVPKKLDPKGTKPR